MRSWFRSGNHVLEVAQDGAIDADERSPNANLSAQLISGGSWVLIGRCCGTLAVMAMNALLTRILAPDEAGAYFLVFSLIVTAASLAQLGLPAAIVNLVADAVGGKRWGRARAAIRITMWSASAAIATASLLAFAFGPALTRYLFHSATVSAAMTIACAWLAVRGIQTLLGETFRALKDLRSATIHSGLLSTIISVIAFAAIWSTTGHTSLATTLWISIAAGILDAMAAGGTLRFRLTQFARDSTSITLREIMRTAWPLWGATIVWILGRENDVWVLSVFRPSHEVALYAAGVRLAAVASMPLMIVNAVAPPFIAELHGRERTRELELMLRVGASAAFLPSLCVLVVFALAGRHVLSALYGSFYSNANGILLVATLSAFVDVATGASGLALMMTGRGGYVLRISLLSMVAALVMKLVLVARWGGVGVAIGAALGLMVQNAATLLAARREIGVWTSVLNPKDSLPAARMFLVALRRGRNHASVGTQGKRGVAA